MRRFRTLKFNIVDVDRPENRMDVLKMKEVIESQDVYLYIVSLIKPIWFEDYVEWLEG